MQVNEAILNRVSCRTYTSQSFDEDQLAKIDLLLQSANSLPFSPQVRTKLIYSSSGESIDFKQFGTYGFVKNCPAFIVLAVEKGPYALENAGFAGEKIILALTQMGIGSCWLGGSFRRSKFSSAIELKDNEFLPAVIALGHAASKRSFVDRAIVWSAKSRTRLPLDQLFFNQGEGDLDEQRLELIKLIQAAPSASNKQPWRVVIDGKHFHFFVAPDEKYQKTLSRAKLVDLQRVDMGIALAHIFLAASEKDLNPQVLVLPDTHAPQSTWSYCFSVEI